MQIRDERAGDAETVAALITEAFATAPHAGGNEAEIVAALREAGALSLSFVADEAGALLGHVAASPAAVGLVSGWACIAPVSVLPTWQGQGIGADLMRAALTGLRAHGFEGAVLVGDPAYYSRFGFRAHPGLTAAGIPDAYVLGLAFGASAPSGEIAFHPAFGLG